MKRNGKVLVCSECHMESCADGRQMCEDAYRARMIWVDEGP